MKEKDLKKLNRYQLLELLIVQTDRADKLQAKLDAMEEQLKAQAFNVAALGNMGSIAEASLQLGEVFQAAQKAADIYIEAAKKHGEEIEEAAHKKAAEILSQALEQARRIKGG